MISPIHDTLIHSFIRSFIHSLTHSLTHSFIHSFIYLFIHSFIQVHLLMSDLMGSKLTSEKDVQPFSLACARLERRRNVRDRALARRAEEPNSILVVC